jgi:hypothetical protein
VAIKKIGVFCGSSPGTNPVYAEKSRELAKVLARRQITLIFGGGGIGLMKEVAEEMLAAGGEVIGVIPRNLLERHLGFPGLSNMQVVESMHERKATIVRMADGFIALPGGWGTLEEIFEVLTWAQLGYHGKPCGFLNVGGYFDHLISFMNRAVEGGFLLPEHLKMFAVSDDPGKLLVFMERYCPPLILDDIWGLNPENISNSNEED